MFVAAPKDPPEARSATSLGKSTSEKATSDQFEDVNDRKEDKEKGGTNTDRVSSTYALDFLADASLGLRKPLELQTTTPQPQRLQRRISDNTSDATNALLEIARGKAKNQILGAKTGLDHVFEKHLQLIRSYKEIHQQEILDVRNPKNDQPWEQEMWAFLADCRGNFRAGSLSQTKAKALAKLGVPGFSRNLSGITTASASTKDSTMAESVSGNEQEGSLESNEAARMMTAMATRGGMPTFTGPTQSAAMQALMLRRQEEALLTHRLQQQYHFEATKSANLRRRAAQDPDGALPCDGDLYPNEYMTPGAIPAYLQDSKRHEKKSALVAAQRGAPKGSALEEIMRREDLKREILEREQQIASAVATGHLPPGYSSAAPSLGLREVRGQFSQDLLYSPNQMPNAMSMMYSADNLHPNSSVFHSLGTSDPHMNAMIHAKLAQQRAAEVRARLALGVDPSQDRRLSDGSIPYPGFAREAPRRAKAAPKKRTKTNTETSKVKKREQKPRKSWDERMREMRVFFLAHGHTQVLTRGENKELGRWLSSVRCKIRDGLLPARQVQEFRLMENWKHEKDVAALKQERQALSLATETGTSKPIPPPPPKVAVPEPSPAPPAIDDDGHISDDSDSHSSMDAMGAPTGPGSLSQRAFPKNWNQIFEDLVAFQKVFGHCDVKMVGNSSYDALGKWLDSQRSRHKLSQLPESKVQQLRKLGCTGFDSPATPAYPASDRSDPEEAEFDSALRRLKESGNSCDEDESSDGSCESKSVVSSQCLGGSVNSERAKVDAVIQFAKKRDAAAASIDSPVAAVTASATNESTPLCKKSKKEFCTKRQSFDVMLKQLEAYQYVYGIGCSVPKPDGDEGKLGRWLAFQRRQFLAGKLGHNRIEKLRSIGRKEFSESDLVVRAAERAAASVLVDHQ